jgi:hypothetical protein
VEPEKTVEHGANIDAADLAGMLIHALPATDPAHHRCVYQGDALVAGLIKSNCTKRTVHEEVIPSAERPRQMPPGHAVLRKAEAVAKQCSGMQAASSCFHLRFSRYRI